VLALSPRDHKDLFAKVYAMQDRKNRLYEQVYLSHEIFKSSAFDVMSPRFNWGLLETIMLHSPQFFDAPVDDQQFSAFMPHILNELDKAYFLHFAGCPNFFGMFANKCV